MIGVIDTSAHDYDLEELFDHESTSFSLESKNTNPSGRGEETFLSLC